MEKHNRLIAGIMALMLVFGTGTAVVHTKFSIPDSVIATSAETLQYGSLSYEVLDNDNITITGFDDSVTEVEIPSEIDGKPVTAIGANAFLSKKIKSVTIPDSITSIGYQAFKTCKNLTSVSIPDSVVEIGSNAFSSCTALQSVKLSSNVSAIGQHNFSDCIALMEITIPNGVTSIGNSAFNGCISLKSITLPDTLTIIDVFAFRDCNSLESVTIPASVATIGKESFYNCRSLKEITIMHPNCNITNGAITNEYSSYSGVIYGEEGSTAQAYAESKGFTFQTVGSKLKKGDINGDGMINAVDATWILRYYSHLSTGGTMSLDEFIANESE
ncbi:MAG: leucine-rich repeat protein [Ruminococcus sp.]|nr:leucine-rich repeat protein [Ruminococcus sp.]